MENKLAKQETELAQMKEILLEIKADIKNMNKEYVPRQELNDMFGYRDKELREIKDDLKDNKRNLPSWISSIVALVAVVIAYFK